MKTAPLRSIWQELDAPAKRELCRRTETGYRYMRGLVSRGSCSRRLLRDIARALHDMGRLEGPRKGVFERNFHGDPEAPTAQATSEQATAEHQAA